MTSMSSSSILSQSPNERRRSGRARKASAASMRGEASGRLDRARWRTVNFCAAIWSLRVSMTARSSGSASASALQFGEGNAALGARNIVEVGAERIVELPALHLGRRLGRERLLRAEPCIGRDAGDRVARRLRQAGENARGQRAFDGVRHAGSLSSPSPACGRGLG